MTDEYDFNDDIVNVRNALITSLESANSNRCGSGEAAAPSDWLSCRSQQLLIALTLLYQHSKESPPQSWAPQLVAHDIIPRATQLLQRISVDYRLPPAGHVVSAQQQAQAADSARGAARGRNSAALAPATAAPQPLPVPAGAAAIVALLAYIPTSLLRGMLSRTATVLGYLAGSDLAPQREPERSLRALLDQLLSLPTLTAVAEGVRWLMAEAQAVVQGRARGASGGRVSAVEADDEADGSLDDSVDTPTVLYVACGAFSRFFGILTNSLHISEGTPTAAAGPRLPQLLRDLHTSGLVAALCEAVVAVEVSLRPLFAASPKDAAVFAAACYQALVLVANLGLTVGYSAQTRAAALALLQLPEVLRLRLTALKQLAASAPQLPGLATDTAGDAAAAIGLLSGGTRRGVREGRAGVAVPSATASAVAAPLASSASTSSYSSEASGAGAGSRSPGHWSLLDRKALLYCEKSHGISLAAAHETIGSAFLAPLMTTAGARTTEFAQYLPQPPQRFAALTAAACRAMVVELEADARRRRERESGQEQQAAEGGGDGDDRELADAKTDLVFQIGSLAIDAADAVVNACSGGAGGRIRPLEAQTSLPDVLEALGWALRALACNAAAAAECGNLLTRISKKIMTCLEDYAAFRPAIKEEIARRLLPTQLPASLDCLLRYAASQRRPGATAMHTTDLLVVAEVVLRIFMERIVCERQAHDQPPLLVWLEEATAAAASGGAGSGDSSSGGGGGDGKPRRPAPRDGFGLLITMAKLAKREAAAAKTAAVAAPSSSSPYGGPSAMARILVMANFGSSSAICKFLCKLRCQQGRAAPSSQTGAGSGGTVANTGGEDEAAWQEASGGRFAVALREAVAVVVRATVPLLEVLFADGAPAGLLREWRDPNTGKVSDETANFVITLAGCLLVASVVLPPEETLAMEPQRLLALVTRRMQEAATAHAARAREQRPASARARGRGSAASTVPGRSALDRVVPSEEAREQAEAWVAACGYTALALSGLAAHVGLVGTVAGWLRGDGHGGAAGSRPQSRQQPAVEQQQQLDVEALAATMRHWNNDAAENVLMMRKLAEGMASEGSGGGGDRAAVAQRLLMNFATSQLAKKGFSPDLPAFYTRGKGVSGSGSNGSYSGGTAAAAPLRVPRLLLLCGNPRCCNFAGPAEDALRCRCAAGAGWCGTAARSASGSTG